KIIRTREGRRIFQQLLKVRAIAMERVSTTETLSQKTFLLTGKATSKSLILVSVLYLNILGMTDCCIQPVVAPTILHLRFQRVMLRLRSGFR
ncbi:hypothetical protein CFC21_056694, partial [Triticum aestivum]